MTRGGKSGQEDKPRATIEGGTMKKRTKLRVSDTQYTQPAILSAVLGNEEGGGTEWEGICRNALPAGGQGSGYSAIGVSAGGPQATRKSRKWARETI